LVCKMVSRVDSAHDWLSAALICFNYYKNSENTHKKNPSQPSVLPETRQEDMALA
jgi:hypothetical protein